MKRNLLSLTLLTLISADTSAQLPFQGLTHTALGQATLVDNDSILVVSNIGDSGEDGVEIETGSADFLCLSLFRPDIGDEVLLTLKGFGNAATPRSSLTVVSGGGILNFTYEIPGNQLHTVRVYSDDVMVEEFTGLIGPVIITIPEPIPWPSPIPIDVFRGDHEVDVFGTAVDLGADTEIIVMGAGGGLTTVTGDRFAILTPGVSPIRLSRVQVIGTAATGTTAFGVGNHTVGVFGLPHRALGNAFFDEISNGLLKIGNIGDSGDDGLQTNFPPGAVAVRTLFQPITMLQGDMGWNYMHMTDIDGESVATSTIGIGADGLGNGRIAVGVDADDELGWDTFTLQFVRNGQVIRERTIANGASVQLRNFDVTGFGKATQSADGWEGFFIDLVRGGVAFELRFFPIDGKDIIPLMITTNDILATSLSSTLSPTITGIIAILIGRAHAEVQVAAPEQVTISAQLPHSIALIAAYPNPFNPSTMLRFDLPESGQARLSVFDVLGREVARLVEGPVEAGAHEVRFDASHLPSGAYIVRLQTGNHMRTDRITLLR